MHPKIKKRIFEDLINQVNDDSIDYINLVGDIVKNSPEMDGEAFDVNTFISQNKNNIKKMYINNKRPVQAAQELLMGMRR